MELTSKQKIAKEIIIFFISIAIIVLTWVTFWGVNKLNINKVEKLQNEFKILTHNLDSIQSTFPKVQTFDEMLKGQVPVEYLIKDNFYIHIADYAKEKQLDEITTTNLRQLYKFLTLTGYPSFTIPKKIAPNDLSLIETSPTLSGFEKNITQEFETAFPEKKKQKEVYDFLLSRKNITCGFAEFAFNLQGFPLPPPHNIWVTYEKGKSVLEKNRSELTITQQKLYTQDDLKDITKWISIIILTIIYPFRFIILLLLWAIRVLKQKPL